MAEPLLIERTDDGVVTLTLALPERRNAMTTELTAAWGGAVKDLQADSTVRAVVVTGQGTVFCSGGDLSWIEAGASGMSPQSIRNRMMPFYKTWLSIRDLEVPVLAALNGHAVGAGLCLALACDLRWATPTARLSAPFTALGMHPGMAATYLLTEAVGVVRAREILYTGRSLNGEDAEAWGLLNGVCDPEALLPTVLEAAHAIAATAPVAVRLTKAGLTQGTSRTFAEALAWEAIAQPVTMASADFQESLDARREKRPAVYTG
jgi:enoyl-CoA hydratase